MSKLKLRLRRLVMIFDIAPITTLVEFNPSRTIKKGTVVPFIEMASLPTSHRDIGIIAEKEFNGGGAKFKNGDTLFARITPCLENGKTAQVQGLPEGTFGFGSTEFIVMSAKLPEYDKDYVYYLARLPEFRIYAQTHMEGTSGRQRVPWQSLAKFEYRFPPKEGRKSAASFLKMLDKKIASNTAMNQTLEKIALRIFKSWFIDFDPVKANKEGVAFDGLSPEIQALFPSEFEESEVGVIPKGWKVQSLSKTANFLNGLACQKYPPVSQDDALPVIKIAEMRSGYTQKTNEASSTVNSKYIIKSGDFLFSWSGSLTTCYWGHSIGILNQHLFKVTSDIYPQWFYAHWVNYHLGEFIRIAADKATTMGHIKRGHLDEAKVLVPSQDILVAGSRVIAPLINKLIQNQENTRSLIDIRDRFLPKLISGQITVGEAQKELAEAI